jgi:hypothetical protein
VVVRCVVSKKIKLKSMSTLAKYNHYDGLDLSGTHPWQMVPDGGEKFLLVVEGPAIGTTKSADRSVAEAAVVPSHFQEPLVCVRGKSIGETRIVFNNTAAKEIGILDVRVFPAVRRFVRFFPGRGQGRSQDG